MALNNGYGLFCVSDVKMRTRRKEVNMLVYKDMV